MKSSLILLIAFLGSISAHSQSGPDRYTLSGYVRDSASGETLIGASVIISNLPATGAITNAYGFYSITIPAGDFLIIIQYVGYETSRTRVLLDQNKRIDFFLKESVNQLSEVIIRSERDDANVTNIRMGVEKIEIREIERDLDHPAVEGSSEGWWP